MEITLNTEQQLFVISSGNSCSCLGFKVVYEQACELARRLGKAGKALLQPEESDIGTMSQYEQYRSMLSDYCRINDNKTWFDGRTPAKVQKVLDNYRKSGEKVRIFYGDLVTGRDWMDEYDMIGRVGRSMGPMKSPLLIAPGECGGPAMLTSCIVRIIDIESGIEVYRHASYHTPKMALVPAADYDQVAGYSHSVQVESKTGHMETHANFKSQGEAAHWLAFMAGESHDYPTAD